MNKTAFISGIILLLAFSFNSCKDEEPTAPILPPMTSMSSDFSVPSNSTKSADVVNLSSVNYGVSAFTVGYWNLVLGVTLAIPVASFYKSFENKPIYLGDKSWEWKYSVIVLAGNYNARLVGTIRQTDIKWEMYITKSGVGAFSEFKWFEGTSDLDGNAGQWLLYESPTVNEKVIQIDWTRTNDIIGDIRYTYVRESDNDDPNQLSADSNIQYGLQEGDYNAFYHVNYNTRNNESNPFYDVLIEFSSTLYYGRIKAGHYFLDTADPKWHCWNGEGDDIPCP